MLFVGTDADRHHRAHLQLVGVVTAGAQVIAEGAGDDGEDDVVDRAPVGVLDPLEVTEVAAHEGEAPVRADLDVERGARRRGRHLEHLAGGAEAAQHLARAAQGGADAADDLTRAGRALVQSVDEQVEVGRFWPGRPLGRPHRWMIGLLLEIEEDRGDVDPGDAVDERVVALADHGEAVTVEPLDQPQLPERLGAVELLGEDPRREVAQLLFGARRRQRAAAHVVIEVEEGVVDPDRPALLEGDEAQLLAEARDEVQPRLDLVAELFMGRRAALEEDRRGDMHVRPGPLHMEEGSVESGQSIAIHRFILADPRLGSIGNGELELRLFS